MRVQRRLDLDQNIIKLKPCVCVPEHLFVYFCAFDAFAIDFVNKVLKAIKILVFGFGFFFLNKDNTGKYRVASLYQNGSIGFKKIYIKPFAVSAHEPCTE